MAADDLQARLLLLFVHRKHRRHAAAYDFLVRKSSGLLLSILLRASFECRSVCRSLCIDGTAAAAAPAAEAR